MRSGLHWFLSELLGTFLLVLFGCGSVATAVALAAPVGLFQVAIVWGLGLALAITLTGPHSGAHLNPAITVAFAVWTDFPKKRTVGYFGAQFLGAFLAAATLYALFGPAIAHFESVAGIERGAPGSEASAMIFGEFFPNPGGQPWDPAANEIVGPVQAWLAEFLGTALLALGIFGLTAKGNPFAAGKFTPLAIGLLLTSLICLFAPISMAGFNPARDLAPRLFSALTGWKSYAFTANGSGWLTVYVISPVLGAVAGGWLGCRLFSRSVDDAAAKG
ncbi:MAG: aquaporin [Verrucomicrobiae bacterium]|nr:aquaporin [Verrucomicrobiae bacterium]